MSSLKIVGLDPGGTSGFVWGLRVGNRFSLQGFEEVKLDVKNLTFRVEKLVGDGYLRWVIEDFVLYAATAQVMTGSTRRSGLAPVYVMGIVESVLAMNDLDVGGLGVVSYQMKSNANVINDARLRGVGGWIKGKPHCRDAFRHAALWCRSHPE